jgi:hypothetical protein
MNNNANKNNSSPGFMDVSHFTRWLNQLDEKDKSLNPAKRRSKWILTLAILFLLFGLSFIWFPAIRLEHEQTESPVNKTSSEKKQQSGQSVFELPADSFEQILKLKIHEDFSEKK